MKKIVKKTISITTMVSLILGMILPAIPFLAMPKKALAFSETFTSTQTWTAPASVTSVDVEVWGGGGGGGGQNLASDGGGGGGGGAYSKKLSIATVPATGYTVTVGAAGTAGSDGCGGTGGDSWFSTSGTVMAKGGVGGCNSTGTPPAGGAGGAGASGVGDTKFSGGQGEIGNNNATGRGGYGGSSAGTAADGFSGPQTYSTSTYPTASTPAGGGHGGNGGNGAGLSGQAPASGNGGGGGGSGEGTAAETGGAGAVGKVIITYTRTTLAAGTDPATTTVAPESGIRDAGAFTLATDVGSSSVTALTVTLAAAGTPYDGLSEVRITSDDGVTLYFAAISSPASNTLNFSAGTPISVTTTSTPYKIRVTPKTHVNMPVPNGASYDLSPYVSAITVNSNQTGTDSNANTLTIDNLSPNGATAVGGTAGDTANTINWTTSNGTNGPFDTTNGSVIYRWQAASAGAETPDEGLTPSVGSADGTATVACVISSAISTPESKVDGTGGSVGCTAVALTNGLPYTYKAFQRDTRGNYDVGVLIGTFTPVASTVITVDEIGTQTSPLIIPSTGNYIGGAFTMIRGTGTANVTSITITESGTVDALTNLNNIKLQYDLDIVSPFNCASESYNALDTQYGSTDINGFSAANGTSVFTGSVAVSDVQAMCVYVVLDVLSGASDGQTMIVRITNPSTDVAVSAGTVAPSTAQGLGTTTLEVPKITVATEGTQANMVIGTGDNNVGGAFSFTRNTASANVTQIIITDTGTVNANVNISDVRVYYKQEGTCSSTIPVDATLFNSTAGTFNASEKATVTGTMAVGTSKICVYVRVDAGDGAADAQTLEIEISNPSTEVTASAGNVSPATVVAIAGTTTLNLPTYTSLGMPFLYTANNWGTGGSGVSFFLEVYMRQTTGTVYARLLNETDTTGVSGSTLSTTSSTFARVRSGVLTLTDGKTYRVQFGKIGADAGKTMGAKLVVNQNGLGGGGADLAEYYSSSDQLDLAEVVAIDRNQVAAVKRSDKPYERDMLGVVATQPGIILGENVGQSYPIALVGRVPVRVTLENGEIKAGDFLTSSSTAGHAMKATKAGRVLGQALETLDEKNLRDCPNGEQKRCGTVMIFVNLIDYLGSSVELAMEEKNQVAYDDQGVKLEETQIPIASYTESIATSSASMQSDKNSKQQQILTFLKDLKESQNGMISSEVFVGRVAAEDEVITPLIFTDTLYAKKIKADSIEGLEILTGKISALSNQVAGVATPSAVLTNDNITQLGDITIKSAKVGLDLIVLGKLETQGGLIVGGLAEFKNDTIFNSLAQFISKVIFKDNVLFEGRPTFNKDTAGIAVIKKDADQVEVTFEKEYAATPIVSLSMTFDPVKLADGNTEDPKILQKRISEQGYSYFVINRSTRGFTVVLNKSSNEDLTFSWIALAVNDATTAYSKELQSLTATASATPIPSLIPTFPPSITPSPSESPSSPLQ